MVVLQMIGDNNSYPKEPITDPVVEANLKRQIDIKRKNKKWRIAERALKCKNIIYVNVDVEKNTFYGREVLLARKLKYCSENCYTDVEYDKSKNYRYELSQYYTRITRYLRMY